MSSFIRNLHLPIKHPIFWSPFPWSAHASGILSNPFHSAWRWPMLLHGLGPTRYLETYGKLASIAAWHPWTKPDAIVIASGHWECPEFTVNMNPAPTLLFDYSGFLPHTYRLTYPAPGSPVLAARVQELLTALALLPARNQNGATITAYSCR